MHKNTWNFKRNTVTFMLPPKLSASKVHSVLYLIVFMCFCSLFWPRSAFWSKSFFLWWPFSLPSEAVVDHTDSFGLSRHISPESTTWSDLSYSNVDPLLRSLFHNPRVVRTSTAPDPPAALRVRQGKPKRAWTARLLLQTRGRLPWGHHEESSAVCDRCLRLRACRSLPVPLDTGTHHILSLL